MCVSKVPVTRHRNSDFQTQIDRVAVYLGNDIHMDGVITPHTNYPKIYKYLEICQTLEEQFVTLGLSKALENILSSSNLHLPLTNPQVRLEF